MWRSRKFLTAVLTTVVDIATMTLTMFLAPEYLEYALGLVGAISALAVAAIAMWGVEDAAAKRAGIFYKDRK